MPPVLRTLGLVGFAFVLSLVALLPSDSSASVRSTAKGIEAVTLTASADTSIEMARPNRNRGSSNSLRIGGRSGSRVLVRSDQQQLVEAVADRRIVSAKLTLRLNGAPLWESKQARVSLHRLTSNWVEGNGLYAIESTDPDGARGAGSGATWHCATDNNIANKVRDCVGLDRWNIGNGRHPWIGKTADAEISKSTGFIGLDVTSDVRDFVLGDAQNNGWILKTSRSGLSGRAQFASREAIGDGPELQLALEPGDVVSPNVMTKGLSVEDPYGDYSNGWNPYEIEISAADHGSGIARIAIASASGAELAAEEVDCDNSCPLNYSTILSFDPSPFEEGANRLVARVYDRAGNVGVSKRLTLWLDRTPPSVPNSIELAYFDPESKEAVAIWDDSEDPYLPEGSPGSGLDHYGIRYQLANGAWIDPFDHTDSAVVIPDGGVGETVRVEVRAVDAVGNGSSRVEGLLYLENMNPTLSDEEIELAHSIAISDPRVAEMLDDVSYFVSEINPWFSESDDFLGAEVLLTWDSPVNITSDWPSEQGVWRYTATGATGLSARVNLGCDQVLYIDPNEDFSIEGEPTRVSSKAPGCAIKPPSGSSILKASPTQAAPRQRPSENVRRVRIGPDIVYNYDFDHRRLQEPDMPVNLFFWNEAREPDQVKLYTFSGEAGDVMFGRLKQGRRFVWDGDQGAKTALPGCITTDHYRVYVNDAAPDRHFKTKWGFYIVGTSHRDRFEACPFGDSWTGRSEVAEHRIATEAARTWGWAGIHEDNPQMQMYNWERTDRVGDRRYQNNGRATTIKVCSDRFGHSEICEPPDEEEPPCL